MASVEVSIAESGLRSSLAQRQRALIDDRISGVGVGVAVGAVQIERPAAVFYERSRARNARLDRVVVRAVDRERAAVDERRRTQIAGGSAVADLEIAGLDVSHAAPTGRAAVAGNDHHARAVFGQRKMIRTIGIAGGRVGGEGAR